MTALLLRRIAPAALLIAGLGAGAPLAAPRRDGSAAGAPHAVLPELTRDLGTIARGEKVPAAFVVRNEGTADLHVLEVKPMCGCTATSFDAVIPPGGQGTIRLVFDSSRQRGVQKKGVLVRFDDPARPEVTLGIAGFVRPIVDVLPDDLLRLSGEVGRSTARAVLSTDEPGLAPTVAEVRFGEGDPRLEVSLAPAPDAARVAGGRYQWVVTVATTKSTPPGRRYGSVLVKTGIARVPELTLFLVANLTPAR